MLLCHARAAHVFPPFRAAVPGVACHIRSRPQVRLQGILHLHGPQGYGDKPLPSNRRRRILPAVSDRFRCWLLWLPARYRRKGAAVTVCARRAFASSPVAGWGLCRPCIALRVRHANGRGRSAASAPADSSIARSLQLVWLQMSGAELPSAPSGRVHPVWQ